MASKHAALAEFVQQTMAEKDVSFRKVAERSGGLISHSTVAEIANGQRFDVRRDTLVALAKGLGVPEADVFRAARGIETTASERFEFYAERFDAEDLTESEWQYLELFFKDAVDRFRHEKVAFRERITAEANAELPLPGKVAARIDPPTRDEQTRDEIQDKLDAEAREPTRKRKTG